MSPTKTAQWRNGTRSDRIRLMAVQVAEHGFSTPFVLRLVCLLRIGLYVIGGIGFALATSGIGDLGSIGIWWREPIVFQKVVLWSLVFEALGLGCANVSRDSRGLVPVKSVLHWLRPGAIRLPPFRLPLTNGDTRSPIDVGLYLLFLATTIFALLSDGTAPGVGSGTVGVIPVWNIALIIGLFTLLALRDKVFFVTAGLVVFGTLTVTFLFSGVDMIVAAKLVMVLIWISAATGKFNRHLPFFIAIMKSDSPPVLWTKIGRRFYKGFPDDLRPGRLATVVAHAGTFAEFTAPLVMLFSPGTVGHRPVVAATALVLVHLVILSALPVGVPLEWSVFMIFGLVTLFLDKAQIRLGDLQHPIPVAVLVALIVAAVAWGNLSPRHSWFLPPNMRYFAGNANTTLWCVGASGVGKIQAHLQLEKYCGSEQAEVLAYLGYTQRAMNVNGRGLFTLANRAIPPGHEGDHTVVLGEWICGAAVGLQCADGTIHNEQLVAALQRRCHFEPGEVRIVLLDAQPIHRQTQDYRLLDAATGEFERGQVKVADMVTRQPWAEDVPHTRSGR